MKTSRNKIIITFGLILLVSVATYSQNDNNDREKRKGPPSIKQLFKDLDANEDGKLSIKEVKGPLKKDFKKIDTNEDGFLSKEEIKKISKTKKGRKTK